jgi:hypothetical protein
LLAASGILAVAVLGGAAPANQPIWFSHKVHVGEARMGCTSCHVYAERGPVAGVPSMSRCRGCHKFVKEDKERPRIDQALKELQRLLAEDRPVAWARVHRLPDHVYFTHQRHVVDAKLACRECHGDVDTMDVVQQVSPLTMGWCLSCHQRPENRGTAPTDCWACHK